MEKKEKGRKHRRGVPALHLDASSSPYPSFVLDQSLDFIDKVPGQLQDLLGVVPLGHFWNTEEEPREVRPEQPSASRRPPAPQLLAELQAAAGAARSCPSPHTPPLAETPGSEEKSPRYPAHLGVITASRTHNPHPQLPPSTARWAGAKDGRVASPGTI